MTNLAPCSPFGSGQRTHNHIHKLLNDLGQVHRLSFHQNQLSDKTCFIKRPISPASPGRMATSTAFFNMRLIRDAKSSNVLK